MLPGLSSGMIPKMERLPDRGPRAACRRPTCSTAGQPHAVLLEIFTDSGIGTMVVPDKEAETL